MIHVPLTMNDYNTKLSRQNYIDFYIRQYYNSLERDDIYITCAIILRDKLYCCRVLLIYNLFPLSVSGVYYTHKNGNLAREDRLSFELLN